MTASSGVAAVLAGSPQFGLDDQTKPVQRVFTGADGLGQAVASDAEWIWLLAPGVRPDADALERLLEKVAPDGERPAAVVAGMVVDHAGRPVEDQLPAPGYADPAATVRLVERRTLPIRHAPFANCLVRRSDLERCGLPDFAGLGPYAASAWTAARLRTEPGYLAPLSVVRFVLDPPRATPRDLLRTGTYAIRVTRSGAWTKGESLRAVMGRLRALRR